MEKINMDCKRRIWKIEAILFNMHKLWCSSFKSIERSLVKLLWVILAMYKIICKLKDTWVQKFTS